MARGWQMLGVMRMDSQSVNSGLAKPTTQWGEFNNIAFLVQQALLKVQTATLVRIESCTNNGGLEPVGFVDVTPLVNQIDGKGNATPHVTIYNVPYLRIQGGANAIIIDPQAGDVGVCVFASRDITKVKSTKKQANPGSWRQYSFADGLYLGGMLNGTPSQYIQFNNSGVTITAPLVTINGNVQVNGAIVATGDVTGQGTSLHTHKHGDTTPGNGQTGVPV